MNIAIVGASRGVGRALCTLASAQGHAVTAIARHASALPLEVVKVDVDASRPGSLELRGHDAVVCAVGGAGLSDRSSRTAVTQVIVAAMRAQGLKRLVLISSLGAGDSYARCSLPTKAITRTLLRHAMVDHNGQEALLGSDLDWTVLRPGGLTDGRTGHRVVDSPTEKLGGGGRVGRDDVAEVALRALVDGLWVRQAVAVLAR
jgi:putative NADH-flavin reductase